MATFKKGGTSRGAGAATKGFDYSIYKKGGKVKKYAEGGSTRKEYGGPESMPEWNAPQYSFSDIKKFFTGKGEEPKAEPDLEKTRPAPGAAKEREPDLEPMRGRRELEAPSPTPVRRPSQAQSRNVQRQRALRMAQEAAQQPPGGSPRPRSDVTPETETPGFRPPGPVMREGRRPLREMEDELETMARERATQAPYTRIPRAREPEVMRILRRAVHGEERAREMEARGYAKGGKVKMAGGGSCRGMGAATKGGKYTIK